MELASTAAAVAETAEKVYEGTQDIRKVSNVTSEVKNVADSEGKDQLDATIGMASSRELSSTSVPKSESGFFPGDIGSDNAKLGVPEKSIDDAASLGSASDNLLKGASVFDEGIPAGAALQNPLKDATVFDEGIPAGAALQSPLKGAAVFDEGIPKDANPALVEKLKNVEVSSESEMNKPVEGIDDSSSVLPEDETALSENEAGQNKPEVSEDTGPRRISTINEGLAGTKHPVTGVPFEEKVVETDTGERVKGVFPEFESAFDVQLPKDLELATDKKQFDECNRQLKEKCREDSEFRSKFTPDQLADIEDGYTPEGYTWHHNEEKGKMQLVDTDTHWNTRHTGGRYIWGGGTENRR